MVKVICMQQMWIRRNLHSLVSVWQSRSFGEDILTVKLQNFCTIDEIAKEAGGFDFILADFGGSFMQIDNLKRGFSFRADGPLDLRLNQEKGISAAEPDPQKCAGG